MDGVSLIIVVAVFALAIIALNKSSRLEGRLRELSLQLDQLRGEFEHLSARTTAGEAPTVTPGVTGQAIAPVAEAAEPASDTAPPEAVVQATTSTHWGRSPEPRQPEAGPSRDVEQALASRWFVWIGGLAIAIGGVLFVKYAFDAGWLSPLTRCVLGLLGGLALIAGGDRLRRTPVMAAQPNYVPAALTAAGLVIAFGSVYAAYAFYQLLPPLMAFAIMAAIALAAFLLSLVQGPLIAALGLIGSYATPTLIPSQDPSAWGFFPYIFIILAASLALLRVRTWWWLGYAAVGGSLIWGLLWAHGGIYEAADSVPLGLFAIAIASLSFFAISGMAILQPGSGSLTQASTITPPLAIGLAGVAAGLLVLCANAIAARHGAAALALLLAGTLGAVAVGFSKEGMAPLPGLAGILALVTLGAWYEGEFTQIAYDELGNAVRLAGPGARSFLLWLGTFGAALAVAGYAGVRWRDAPVIWAAISAGGAILFGALGLGRAHHAISSGQWMAAGLVIALAFGAAIWSLRARAENPAQNLALGLFAVAATAAALLALDEAFDRLWLTLALAALVPALGLASLQVRIQLFGPIATAVAGLVVLRLLIARELWFGEDSLPLGEHWPLYGYGAPAILFWGASRLFQASGYSRSHVALEGSALGVAVALLSLELRVLIAGRIQGQRPGLLEAGAHVMAWCSTAYGLLHRQQAFSRIVSRWGAMVLLAAATGLTVFGSLILLNPVVSGDAVPGGSVVNALLLAYLAPSVLGAFIARKLDQVKWQELRAGAGILSLVLLLAYLTLETKRLFQGAVMVPWSQSDAENYAYSAVWLAAALALFVAGIRIGQKYVRLAGLAVMMVVVFKVFVIDLSGIGGLYRIASFVGLGLCLVGIGWLYARYVQRPLAKAALPD